MENEDWNAIAAWTALVLSILIPLIARWWTREDRDDDSQRLDQAHEWARKAEERAERDEERLRRAEKRAEAADVREQARFLMDRQRHDREMERYSRDDREQLSRIERREWADSVRSALVAVVREGRATNPEFGVRPEERELADWAVDEGLLEWSPSPSLDGLMLPHTTVAGTLNRR